MTVYCCCRNLINHSNLLFFSIMFVSVVISLVYRINREISRRPVHGPETKRKTAPVTDGSFPFSRTCTIIAILSRPPSLPTPMRNKIRTYVRMGLMWPPEEKSWPWHWLPRRFLSWGPAWATQKSSYPVRLSGSGFAVSSESVSERLPPDNDMSQRNFRGTSPLQIGTGTGTPNDEWKMPQRHVTYRHG